MDAPTDTEKLVEWLSDHDAACPVCSYNCRGLTTPACPECAAPLRLALASDRLTPAPWAMAMVSFSLGLGFDAVIVVLMTILFIFNGPPPAQRLYALALLLGFAALASACGGGIAVLSVMRGKWVRRNRAAQWRLAIAIFLLVGVVHAVFGLFVAGVL